MPRGLVHRTAVAEVFLTGAERRDDDTFDMYAQIPRSHAFYGDTLGPGTSYDPMVLVEIARQSCAALTHEYLGVALSQRFLLRTAELRLLDPTRMMMKTVPTEVVARSRIERRFADRSGLTGLTVRCTTIIDDVVAAAARMKFSWVDSSTWTDLRRENRSRYGLAGQPTTVAAHPPRAAAHAVGRWNPANVVIAEPRYGREGDVVAFLVVDTAHPTMFDHPLDHVPGMLQLEAFRQLSVVAAARSQAAPAAVWLTGLSARFRAFTELDVPSVCRLVPFEPPGAFRCTLSQAGSVVSEATVHLAEPPGPTRNASGSARESRAGAGAGAGAGARTPEPRPVVGTHESRPAAGKTPTAADTLLAATDTLLTTTRSVHRRLDLSRPVPRNVVEACLEVAVQAPNGANRQQWRFLLIDDPVVRDRVAEHYRAGSEARLREAERGGESPELIAWARVLAETLHRVPVLVLACSLGRLPADSPVAHQSSVYGSIYPALWSFMLAARARGLGTALTTAHLARERAVADLLGIPFDEVTQVALVAVGHVTGNPFRPGSRAPAVEVTTWNHWWEPNR
jgi:nitroreductase